MSETMTIESNMDRLDTKVSGRLHIFVMCCRCQGIGRCLFDDEHYGCPDCCGTGVPKSLWSNKTKLPEAKKWALKTGCYCCGKKPDSVSPLSAGFIWDTVEPDASFIFCNKCSGINT